MWRTHKRPPLLPLLLLLCVVPPLIFLNSAQRIGALSLFSANGVAAAADAAERSSVPEAAAGEHLLLALHPRSPREAADDVSPPHPSVRRVKRQAYELQLDNEVSVMTVDKEQGEKETGNWGPWTKDRECSRSVGGGEAN